MLKSNKKVTNIAKGSVIHKLYPSGTDRQDVKHPEEFCISAFKILLYFVGDSTDEHRKYTHIRIEKAYFTNNKLHEHNLPQYPGLTV